MMSRRGPKTQPTCRKETNLGHAHASQQACKVATQTCAGSCEHMCLPPSHFSDVSRKSMHTARRTCSRLEGLMGVDLIAALIALQNQWTLDLRRKVRQC